MCGHFNGLYSSRKGLTFGEKAICKARKMVKGLNTQQISYYPNPLNGQCVFKVYPSTQAYSAYINYYVNSGYTILTYYFNLISL